MRILRGLFAGLRGRAQGGARADRLAARTACNPIVASGCTGRRPAAARLAALLACAALAGCAARGPGGYVLDTSLSSRGQSSRVQFIVLHYTAGSLERSLHVLSHGQVGAHYVVTDEQPPRLLRMVDESRSAWHAGESAWRGYTWLNSSSIGVEIVNPGWTRGPDGAMRWHPYPDWQIDAMIALVRDLAERHGVKPENIVGHSDIAPRRKMDPGPLFPWKRLADAGLGRWYDETLAARYLAQFQAEGLPEIGWFQQHLARIGYDVPQSGVADDATQAALAAFQLHYRPRDFSGLPDAETAALLAAMP